MQNSYNAGDFDLDLSKVMQLLSDAYCPRLEIIIKIMITLPISTATAERSFSSLLYVKNKLRNSMLEDRLNHLAHIYIHKDIPLVPDKILDKYGMLPHKIPFSLAEK